MTKIIKNIYDYIIYGATLSGIVSSIIMKEKGAKILLVNHYGFPGGSITESLNCYQEFEPSELSQVTFRIYDRIIKERNAIISFEGKGFYINPETFKQVLLFEAVNSGVDLLFHTRAKAIINNSEEDKIIELLAKEGLIQIKSRKIIDCTDDKYLSTISGSNNLFSGRYRYNFIINDNGNILNQTGLSYRKLLDIGDGRKWVSCEVNADSSMVIEQNAQELLDYHSQKLQEFGAAIQILPSQAQLIMESNLYKPEEMFIEASVIEKGLNHKS